jgi:hypothetical protein
LTAMRTDSRRRPDDRPRQKHSTAELTAAICGAFARGGKAAANARSPAISAVKVSLARHKPTLDNFGLAKIK